MLLRYKDSEISATHRARCKAEDLDSVRFARFVLQQTKEKIMKSLVFVILLLWIIGSIFAATTSAETNIFSITPQTLPIELSSFSAVQTSSGSVFLRWITESETDLLGYRIYRGETRELNVAIQISAAIISGTNTSTSQIYSYEDKEVVMEQSYYYWLESVDLDGSSMYHTPVNIFVSTAPDGDNPPPQNPMVTGISSIYPNPFNPMTYVSFTLKDDAKVSVSVYNQKGQLIRKLLSGFKTRGEHHTSWDAKDSNGQSCASGIYYFKMNADQYSELRKAVLMK